MQYKFGSVASRQHEESFDQLVEEVKACRLCERMGDSQRVLSRAAGKLTSKVMFIGEAPGRLGADESGIPFHGDKAGHNFEELLSQVGLDRYNLFITNAVLCNPKDDAGNNSVPRRSEVVACSDFLKRQIELVDAEIVVTLGGAALFATSLVERHELSLREHVRQVHRWFGRLLIPTYHPGQRAMIHRSFANQLADYQFISETAKRVGKRKYSIGGSMGIATKLVVDLITRLRPELSYFALHKLFYLVEFQSAVTFGQRLTNAFIVRQKDGPYCTELHPLKLKKALPDLEIHKRNSKLFVLRRMPTLFSTQRPDAENLSPDVVGLVEAIVDKYSALDDSKLKTVVYLTRPMKEILRLERTGRANLFNCPINFPVKSREL